MYNKAHSVQSVHYFVFTAQSYFGSISNQVLAFCKCNEIMELAASKWRHWSVEIFTVETISSSRLKPHGTDWSQYGLLSLSVRRDEGGPLEPGTWRHYNFRDSQRDLVVQEVMFDRATCNPAQGVLAQGIWGCYFTHAYFCYWRLCLGLHPRLSKIYNQYLKPLVLCGPMGCSCSVETDDRILVFGQNCWQDVLRISLPS